MDWEKTALKLLYEPIDTLKESDISDVYLVYDKKSKHPCLLKRRNIASRPVYDELQNINSRALPQIYRLVADGDNLWIVEEFVDGESLTEVLSRRQDALDERTATDILRQMCACLGEVHGKNIIHRDIKPSNIMLTKEGIVKLIDFGIARTVKYGGETDTGVLGTKGYAPPEQYGFGQTDPRSDIYALGITMMRLLGKDYDGALLPILQKCAALDPANRYTSTAELWQAVEEISRRKKVSKIIPVAALCFVVGVCLWSTSEDHFPKAFETNPAATVPTFEQKKLSADNDKTETTTESSAGDNRSVVPFINRKFPTADSRTPSAIPTEPNTSNTTPTPSAPTKLPIVPTRPKQPTGALVFAWMLNGKPLGDEATEIPATEWQKWPQDSQGRILFPADWVITLRAVNGTDATYDNLIAEINYPHGRKVESVIAPPGRAAELTIPLTNCYFESNSCVIGVLLSNGEDIPGVLPKYREFYFWLAK